MKTIGIDRGPKPKSIQAQVNNAADALRAFGLSVDVDHEHAIYSIQEKVYFGSMNFLSIVEKTFRELPALKKHDCIFNFECHRQSFKQRCDGCIRECHR